MIQRLSLCLLLLSVAACGNRSGRADIDSDTNIASSSDRYTDSATSSAADSDADADSGSDADTNTDNGTNTNGSTDTLGNGDSDSASDIGTDTMVESDTELPVNVDPCGDVCHWGADCVPSTTESDTDTEEYLCQCRGGYTGDGLYCTDINECAAGTHNCSDDTYCLNTNTSYTCIPDCGPLPVTAGFPSLQGGDIVFKDDLAIIASGNGLHILDISNPTAPSLLGTALAPNGYQTEFAVYADLVLWAKSENLTMFDFSDPSNPFVLSQTTLSGSPADINVHNDTVYMSDNDDDGAQLMIVDISDPTAPTQVSADVVSDFHRVRTVRSGDVLYVVDHQNSSGNLRLYDISIPTAPTLLATEALPHYLYSIKTHNAHLYISNTKGNFSVYDLATPTAPVFLGTQQTVAGSNFTFDGDLMIARRRGKGALLAFFDISDPAQITDKGFAWELPRYSERFQLHQGEVYHNNGSWAVYRQGSAQSDPHTEIDTDLGPAPDVIYNVRPGQPMQLLNNEYESFVSVGEYFLAVDKESGIHVLRLQSDDFAYAQTHRIPGASSEVTAAYDIAIKEQTALVAAGSKGVVAYDISALPDMTVKWVLPVVGTAEAWSVYVDSETLYVGAADGLHVIDISDIHSPAEVGYTVIADGDTTYPVWDIAIDGDRAYTAGSCVAVIDISDAAHPNVRSVTSMGDNMVKVEAVGDYAYTIAYRGVWGGGGVGILDARNPERPAVQLTHGYTENTSGLQREGNRLYVAAGSVFALDITDPGNPQKMMGGLLQAFSSMLVTSNELEVRGNRLCGRGNGIYCQDITSFAYPNVLGRVPMAGADLWLDGDQLYTSFPFTQIDISTPAAPVMTNFVDLFAPPYVKNYTSLGKLLQDGELLLRAKMYSLELYRVEPELTLLSSLNGLEIGAGDLELVNGYVYYMVDHSLNDPLFIIDYSDTSDMKIAATWPDTPANHYKDMDYDGSHVFLVDSHDRIDVLDVSTPAAPSLLTSIPYGGVAIMVENNIAYVPDTNDTLTILDVSDVTSLTELAMLPVSNIDSRAKIKLEDGILYLTSRYPRGNITRIDVQDPAHPSLIDVIPVSGSVSDLEVKEGLLYVSQYTEPFDFLTLSGLAMEPTEYVEIINPDVCLPPQ